MIHKFLFIDWPGSTNIASADTRLIGGCSRYLVLQNILFNDQSFDLLAAIISTEILFQGLCVAVL
jgi:hypothetical protein